MNTSAANSSLQVSHSRGLKFPPNCMYYVCNRSKVQQWVRNYKAYQAYYLASLATSWVQSHPAVLEVENEHVTLIFLNQSVSSKNVWPFSFLAASHQSSLKWPWDIIWASCTFGLGGHNHQGGLSLHHHYWHGIPARVRGHLFRKTKVCKECHPGGNSTPIASQTLVKSVCPVYLPILMLWKECIFCLVWYTGQGWRSSRSKD